MKKKRKGPILVHITVLLSFKMNGIKNLTFEILHLEGSKWSQNFP